MINSYCNMSCPYCFASREIKNCKTNNMSINNFKKILEWHKTNNMRVIRILGGEPTIHPKISEMLDIVKNDSFFEGIYLFSNMLFSDEIKKEFESFSKKKKLKFLPNFNEEVVIGRQYQTVKDNISFFAEIGCIDIIGINIYKTNYDFTNVIDFAKVLGIKKIRWSLTIPNYEMPKDFDVKRYFNKYYETLIKFFKICNENSISTLRDCSSVPPCCFSVEQVKELLAHNSDFFDGKTSTTGMLSCDVVIDINPNMEVFRCFGVAEEYKTFFDENMSYFDCVNEIRLNTKEIEEKLLFDECSECFIYKKNGNKSCSCVNYRKNK